MQGRVEIWSSSKIIRHRIKDSLVSLIKTMPDWIVLIISFAETYVMPIAVGLLAFVLSYHYFGDWEEFKRPEMFWIILVLCVAIALSVSILIKRLRDAIINARAERIFQQEKQLRLQRQWEEAVVSRVRALPTPIQFKFKSACRESFEVIGHDLIIIELSELEAVKVVDRTTYGLRIMLTEKGIAAVRKKCDSIF